MKGPGIGVEEMKNILLKAPDRKWHNRFVAWPLHGSIGVLKWLMEILPKPSSVQ